MKSKNQFGSIVGVTVAVGVVSVVVVSLCGVLVSRSQAAPPLLTQSESEGISIIQDIHSLNLINGLDLTPEQVKAILENAKKTDELVKAGRAELAKVSEQNRPVMEQLRELLKSGKDIPNELAAQVHRFTEQTQAILYRLGQQRDQLAQEVLNVLNENQIALLDEYKPCLIPPKGRDTSRIGQPSGSATVLAEHLARVRRIPQPMWERQKEQIVGRMIERLEKQLYLKRRPANITDEERKQLLATLEEARKLSDTDFEAQKETLAKKLMIRDYSEQERQRNERRRLERIGQFLIHPRVVALLRERVGKEK